MRSLTLAAWLSATRSQVVGGMMKNENPVKLYQVQNAWDSIRAEEEHLIKAA
jgi:hypothetical protein